MIFFGGGRRQFFLTSHVTTIFVGEEVDVEVLEKIRTLSTGAKCVQVRWLVNKLEEHIRIYMTHFRLNNSFHEHMPEPRISNYEGSILSNISSVSSTTNYNTESNSSLLNRLHETLNVEAVPF